VIIPKDGLTLTATATTPAGVTADDPAEPFEDGLVLFEGRRHLIRSHPRIGIQTFRPLFQLFPGLFFKRALGNPRHDLGVPGAQAHEPFGAETLVGGGALVLRARRERISGRLRGWRRFGAQGFLGFSGFSGFSRFSGFSGFSGFCGF
jgi:hypothetical protein